MTQSRTYPRDVADTPIPTNSAKPSSPHGWFSPVAALLSRTYMKINGWRAVGDWPGFDKAVLVAAPHTSNWDGLNMLAAAGHYQIRLRWMGKKSLTTGPFGWFLKALGCVPVDRKGVHDMVKQMADAFAATRKMILAVPPEGTRGKGESWKTGFYHIAHGAGVPIVLSVLDYGQKTMQLAAVIWTTGDIEADMKRIAPYYENAVAKKPEFYTPPVVG